MANDRGWVIGDLMGFYMIAVKLLKNRVFFIHFSRFCNICNRHFLFSLSYHLPVCRDSALGTVHPEGVAQTMSYSDVFKLGQARPALF